MAPRRPRSSKVLQSFDSGLIWFFFNRFQQISSVNLIYAAPIKARALGSKAKWRKEPSAFGGRGKKFDFNHFTPPGHFIACEDQ